MEDVSAPAVAAPSRRWEYIWGFGIFLVIAVAGLFLVKWNPYFHKALTAAATHTLGPSIVSGKRAAPPAPSFGAALGYAVSYLKSIWQALVVGLLLAATIETLLPRDWIARALGKPTARTAALGGALALPGMMCTCCTAPVIVGMRKSGAATGCSVAFFLGNPTLNPAVLVFLVVTLGWQWAALRLVLGVALVAAAAFAATRLTAGAPIPANALPTTARPPELNSASAPVRWLRALARLIISLIPEYIVIVLALGAARAFLFPAIGPAMGASVLLLLGLAVAGTLFVIPTAGEIPIIQTLMAFGLGAGPAAALLLTLAPISLPSLAMVGRVFPARVLAALVGLTICAGILAGFLAMGLRL